MMRRSGLILHPTSLPSQGGIGTLGTEAYEFIDFLAEAEQRVWQVLPLGPSDLGSPYMATSAFAGDPLLIRLESLCEARWLPWEELLDWPETTSHLDLPAVRIHKRRCLTKAHQGFLEHAPAEQRAAFARFCAKNAYWLEDFALFTALQETLGGQSWNQWPLPLRLRDPKALEGALEEHSVALSRVRFEQFIFFSQWMALVAHAHRRGVSIMGDIPIFVAFNSADVWAHSDIFWLDSQGQPTVVAGVPPDYFSEDGQFWGNPLYRWDALAKRGYDWWVARMRKSFELYDMLRIDHFRAFSAYWEIPSGAKTAKEGRWVPGPGKAFFDRMRQELGEREIIAEDLGTITEDVTALREAVGLPGMKILQFAFDGDPHNLYLPHNHDPKGVVYTGTHDNDTLVGWYTKLDPKFAHQMRTYLAMDGKDIAWQMITVALRSVAQLSMTTVQDLLSLGSEGRMNTPAVIKGNWSWRLLPGQLHRGIALRLKELTLRYGRYPEPEKRKE